MRGYDVEEVDDLIIKLEAKNRLLTNFQQGAEVEMERLKQKLSDDSEELNKYRNDERNLRDAFAGVQRVEAQIREDAEREISELMEKARTDAKAMTDRAHEESEAKLNESAEMLMKATAERDTLLEKTQEKVRELEAEAEKILEKRKAEIQETLRVLEAETMLKQESLDRLKVLEGSYRTRSDELQGHVDAILNLFGGPLKDNGERDSERFVNQ